MSPWGSIAGVECRLPVEDKTEHWLVTKVTIGSRSPEFVAVMMQKIRE